MDIWRNTRRSIKEYAIEVVIIISFLLSSGINRGIGEVLCECSHPIPIPQRDGTSKQSDAWGHPLVCPQLMTG